MKLPLKFFGKANTLAGTQTPWHVESSVNKATCCIPVEFDGPGKGFSPEDLFLQSLVSCFIGTFKVFAEYSKVKYSEINIEGVLTVDKNSENQTIMKHTLLKIYPKDVEQKDRFNHLAEKVMKSGFILNSVKTELEYEIFYENTDEGSYGLSR